MSQLADHQYTIAEMLKTHPECYKAVIDTFYNTISNQSWKTESIIEILESGMGILDDADTLINKIVKIEKSY